MLLFFSIDLNNELYNHRSVELCALLHFLVIYLKSLNKIKTDFWLNCKVDKNSQLQHAIGSLGKHNSDKLVLLVAINALFSGMENEQRVLILSWKSQELKLKAVELF